MAAVVEPKPMSGFPEFLPEEQILFNRMLDIVRRGFEHYGFSPIETPAVERKEILTSKGGLQREIYALCRLAAEDGESAETEYALHFDLTVPLARYVAMYKDKLAFPFRRYQIQKVWRGERAQAGRYREFYQCDIDVIGRGELSIVTDAEIPSVIYEIFRKMGIGPFVIRVNNRKILQGFFASLGVASEHIADVLRTVDKLAKIGDAAVINELKSGSSSLDEQTGRQIIDFMADNLATDDILSKLQSLGVSNDLFAQGVEELKYVVDGIRAFGVPEDYFQVDLSIARGLDYYTGTVYETVLVDHPSVGSICGGGRYDDLASYFTDEKFPGVGISIGLTRLVPQLLSAGVLVVGSATPAQVLVTALDQNHLIDYLRLGAQLRDAGIATEVYLERERIGEQLRYASKKGFQLAVIAGPDEFSQGNVKLKNLVTGSETTLPLDSLVQSVNNVLS